MQLSRLRLKKNEERRLLAGHLWIYSNEIDVQRSPFTQFQPGELVCIESYNKRPLGIGYINPKTLLCVRLLTRDIHEVIDVNFFKKRITQALSLRQNYFAKPFYRLVFAESDRLPGIIIDRYGDFLVLQLNTAGAENFKKGIIDACIDVIKPRGILIKNDTPIRELEGLSQYVEVAYGEFPEDLFIEENNIHFFAPAMTGQKTGWFYDHRFNRLKLLHYVKNKRVLDLFSYVGGWGIQCAVHGAKQVCCVDGSEKALAYVKRNAEENHVTDIVSTIHEDVFDSLEKLAQQKEKFDVIILDPPALIKRNKDKDAGMKAYLKLNQLALEILNPQGILATSSCSMHLSETELLDIVRQAGLNIHRELYVLETLSQASDHPIHPAIKETYYLKGFIVGVGSD